MCALVNTGAELQYFCFASGVPDMAVAISASFSVWKLLHVRRGKMEAGASSSSYFCASIVGDR